MTTKELMYEMVEFSNRFPDQANSDVVEFAESMMGNGMKVVQGSITERVIMYAYEIQNKRKALNYAKSWGLQ